MLKQNPSKIIEPNNYPETCKGNHIDDLILGNNLNICNTEMDNVQLLIRNEFEENNFYSLWS